MARRVSIDDIRHINEIYYKCKNYAETARQTGWSAATVRNYVDHNFSPITEAEIYRFNPETDMPEFSTAIFEGVENYGELCVLSKEELEEIEQLWKELAI